MQMMTVETKEINFCAAVAAPCNKHLHTLNLFDHGSALITNVVDDLLYYFIKTRNICITFLQREKMCSPVSEQYEDKVLSV